MITSLLIANRGEIACRINRTAKTLGIRTVAVYSDADAKALHVRQADEAVHIGPSPARESYLAGEKIIAAAKATGAEAIHPGYGFLSENADFAQSVLDAGLIWVGPNPSSIRAMGLKDAAKKLMDAAGVPTTPGYLGEDQHPERLRAEADAIGYPVLIKAVAGGGGKGMRLVEAADAFADGLLSAKREAASSFGNDAVLLEKYIQRPRHIEVQVFGDTHGNIVHLFERDCSLQRRHQKVIEEAPAPGMDAATRAAICDAAVKAARAVDYVGAGTIEFIADASEGLRADRIWFMEMNTRLQVEHPVTEEITGQDLVEWQLRVASGERLPKRQEELSINGHAMEARLYAEDPSNGFLPSIGKLETFADYTEGRFETGFKENDEVTPFYDPMIAKLVTWGSDRDEARTKLAKACGSLLCEPVKTNAWFLKRLCEHPAFIQADLSTDFIGAFADELTVAPLPSDLLLQEVAERLIFDGWNGSSEWKRRTSDLDRGTVGFRLNAAPRTDVSIYLDGRPLPTFAYDLTLYDSGELYEVSEASILGGSEATFFEAGAAFAFARRGATAGIAGASDGAIISPMPGRVIAVEVAAGAAVAKGQKLLTLEAMKMEHSLVAPFDGTVAELSAVAGAQVGEGALLARIAPLADAAD
jgi:3-methylcrotonyl-CoA carboxylase alpha subunit